MAEPAGKLRLTLTVSHFPTGPMIGLATVNWCGMRMKNVSMIALSPGNLGLYTSLTVPGRAPLRPIRA